MFIQLSCHAMQPVLFVLTYNKENINNKICCDYYFMITTDFYCFNCRGQLCSTVYNCLYSPKEQNQLQIGLDKFKYRITELLLKFFVSTNTDSLFEAFKKINRNCCHC